MYKSTFKQYLDKQEENKKITKNTAKNYYSNFNALQTLFKTDNIKFIKKPLETIKEIEKTYTNNQTIQAKINIILLLITLYYPNLKEYEDYYKIYEDYINKIRGSIIEEYNKHEPNEKQIVKCVSKEENEKIITTLHNNVKHSIKTKENLIALRDYLVYMILEILPLRGDFCKALFVLDTSNNVYNINTNYFILNKTNKIVKYLQQDYKTVKKYGVKTHTINNELMYKYFVKLYNYYNNKLKIKDKHIFYQTDMITALNENDLSKLYKSIGEKIIQKSISIQINRIQNCSSDGDLIEYLYDKAQAQNHSLGTHTQIYYKKNLIKKT